MRVAAWVISTLLALLAVTSAATAQERVTLAEIVPALAGTELGALDLGEAPVPGAVRVVRRADVLSALRTAGRSADGLMIPRETRIRRAAQILDREALARRAHDQIVAALAPCELREVSVRADATVPAGEVSFEVDGPARPAGSSAVVTILVHAGGRTVRVPAQASIACPEPVLAPGSHVQVVIRVGSVSASADGVARQAGRVGDVVRVHVETTGALVQARVVDRETVEVIR